MQQLLKNYRTMFLFRGLAALAFGIIALVWPKPTLLVLVLLFGIFAIISGITAVAAALQNREEHGWGLLLFEGILWLLAGVVALIWPGVTALSFLYLLAAWAIITGILELIAPLSFPMSFGRGALMVLAGLVSIVFWHSDCRTTCIWAARRGLVDRPIRHCVWDPAPRGIL
jgi:uncharacterized membrane protein HdeD (DUF308 family)